MFAGPGRYRSARSRSTSWENRRPYIADPDFVYRAYVAPSSVWRCQFPGKPSGGSRFHGVAHDDPLLYGRAVGTIEQPMLKSDRTRTDAGQRHPRRALRAARALDGCESRWRGQLRFRHDASLQGGSVTELSVTDGCRWRGGDGSIMPQCKSHLLVNIAHSSKFHVFGAAKSTLAAGEPPAGDRSVKRDRDDRDDEQCGDQQTRAIE
jgi:hypothetical protein